MNLEHSKKASAMLSRLAVWVWQHQSPACVGKLCAPRSSTETLLEVLLDAADVALEA